MLWKPCLQDRWEEAGVTRSEYFWQDLLVARMIHEAKANKHVDVGSRIDGFVAHVASFRELEVLDVRTVAAKIPGVTFRKIDLMSSEAIASLSGKSGYCDSLSCLHVLEHFGLGRYGDPIRPDGWRYGIRHLASLLRPQGTLYLSIPVGKERVEFNAMRVFDPEVIRVETSKNQMKLEKAVFISSIGAHREIPPHGTWPELSPSQPYQLALFVFQKSGAAV